MNVVKSETFYPVYSLYIEHTCAEKKLNESIQHKVDQVILTRREKKSFFSLFNYKTYNAIGGDTLSRLSYLWGGASIRQGRLLDRGV